LTQKLFEMKVENLPRKVLETAIKLNDPLKKVYITIYASDRPIAPREIAKKLGYARAYVHMRCCQLESMNLIRRIEEDRKVTFEAKPTTTYAK
jgi:DNA-binding transcriptional regulator GbsR (MarR family)